MEIYAYGLIAAIPCFVYLFISLAVLLIAFCIGKFCKVMDFFAFNTIPGILKTKKDNNNQTLVYLRIGQDKVLLQDNCIIIWVKKVLFIISLTVGAYMSAAFGHFTFIDYTYDCDGGKDCFLWPSRSAFKADRANCSDPDIQQGKKLIVCYRLMFEPGLAAGVIFGMYRTSVILANGLVTLIGQCSKDCIKCVQILLLCIFFIIVVTTIALTAVFYSSAIMRISGTYFELIFTAVIVWITAFLIIYRMPWDKIIESKIENQLYQWNYPDDRTLQKAINLEMGEQNPVAQK